MYLTVFLLGEGVLEKVMMIPELEVEEDWMVVKAVVACEGTEMGA